MTKKKIVFPITPNRGDLENAIDSWVSSDKNEAPQLPNKNERKAKLEFARTTFIIPKGLYKKLKKISLIEDKSITQKLTEILEDTLPDVWVYHFTYICFAIRMTFKGKKIKTIFN